MPLLQGSKLPLRRGRPSLLLFYQGNWGTVKQGIGRTGYWHLDSSGLWLAGFIFFCIFSQHNLSHSLVTSVTGLIFSSLLFTLLHLGSFPISFSTHLLPDSCMSCFLSSHTGPTSQTCCPWITALWSCFLGILCMGMLCLFVSFSLSLFLLSFFLRVTYCHIERNWSLLKKMGEL